MELVTYTAVFSVLILSVVLLYTINRKRRAKKMSAVFKHIISPSYMVFYRATDIFIDGGKLSDRDKLRVSNLRTTELDYSHLHSQAKAKKNAWFLLERSHPRI